MTHQRGKYYLVTMIIHAERAERRSAIPTVDIKKYNIGYKMMEWKPESTNCGQEKRGAQGKQRHESVLVRFEPLQGKG